MDHHDLRDEEPPSNPSTLNPLVTPPCYSHLFPKFSINPFHCYYCGETCINGAAGACRNARIFLKQICQICHQSCKIFRGDNNIACPLCTFSCRVHVPLVLRRSEAFACIYNSCSQAKMGTPSCRISCGLEMKTSWILLQPSGIERFEGVVFKSWF